MLDKKGQVKAFKILEREGLVTPGPIAISRQVETLAGEKNTAFEAIQLRNTTYTASVSGYMQKIAGFATVADTAQGSVLALVGALSPYIMPSGLLQVRIGWECHVKGHDMDPNLPFPLLEGMADTDTPLALLYSLDAAELDALTAAVNTVNKKVGSTGTPSSAEIQALKETTETMSMQMGAVASESRQMSASASGINGSTALARTSMANAVTVTLSDSMTSDNTMLPAVALILPNGMLDALLEDKT